MKPQDRPDAALDEDLVDALNAELAAGEPALDAATQQRIKSRLLRRIAADNTPRHVTHHPGDEGWQPFGEGLRIKVLHEAGGVMSYLLRLAPGASLPPHRHPVDEECVVLEGAVRIGSLVLGAGGFHLGRQDVLHDRLESPDGALIYLRGAAPDIALIV